MTTQQTADEFLWQAARDENALLIAENARFKARLDVAERTANMRGATLATIDDILWGGKQPAFKDDNEEAREIFHAIRVLQDELTLWKTSKPLPPKNQTYA
jgi:hypothetical protein